MWKVHLFPKPNPFIFSTANLLKDQTEYILLYDQNRRMIHWLDFSRLILHQSICWYTLSDTILHSSTGWHVGSQTSYPMRSLQEWWTILYYLCCYPFLLLYCVKWGYIPRLLITHQLIFLLKKADDPWLSFLLSSQHGHSSSSLDVGHSSQTDTELVPVSGFCTCCVLYMEWFELDKHISSYFLSFRCQLKCHFFYLKE